MGRGVAHMIKDDGCTMVVGSREQRPLYYTSFIVIYTFGVMLLECRRETGWTQRTGRCRGSAAPTHVRLGVTGV